MRGNATLIWICKFGTSLKGGHREDSSPGTHPLVTPLHNKAKFLRYQLMDIKHCECT